MPLVGLAMLDKSAAEGSDKAALWTEFPGWRLDSGLTTLSCKKFAVTETKSKLGKLLWRPN